MNWDITNISEIQKLNGKEVWDLLKTGTDPVSNEVATLLFGDAAEFFLIKLGYEVDPVSVSPNDFGNSFDRSKIVWKKKI
jgi:hypothetical protein